jgi:hypothetical protein
MADRDEAAFLTHARIPPMTHTDAMVLIVIVAYIAGLLVGEIMFMRGRS